MKQMTAITINNILLASIEAVLAQMEELDDAFGDLDIVREDAEVSAIRNTYKKIISDLKIIQKGYVKL